MVLRSADRLWCAAMGHGIQRFFPLASLALLACGGSPLHTPAPAESPSSGSGFPTSAELSQLVHTTPGKLPAGGIEVPSWDLAGPFPDAIEAKVASPAAPWSALLDAAPNGAAVTEDMACVAREMGRFYLEHLKSPSDTLRRFIFGWCGASAVNVDVQFLGGDAPADVADDQIFAKWKKQAAQLVAASAGGERFSGLWFGRKDGRAVFALASGVPAVHLERLPLAPDSEGNVVLSGTVLRPTSRLHARVNRGQLGVADCSLDEGVALPRFVARCALGSADASAWIEITAVAPQRILGTPILRVLARRASARPGYALVDAVPAAAQTATLVDLVNEARRSAGLPPLALAARETELARKLAPIYFSDSFDGKDGHKADRIALGLMAGWDVDAMVTDAGVYSAWVAANPRQLIAACLDSPSGRAVLLDAHATHVAVAAIDQSEPLLTAGLFVTYETIVDDGSADAARGFDLVARARTARGLVAPNAMDGMDDRVARLSRQLRAGEVTPDDAESHLLAHAVRTTGASGLHGAVAEASDLASVKLPDEAFAPGELTLAAIATTYRPADQPWWRWAVVVITGPAMQ
jgi:hypothetical protein